jgi:hypothetical protein
MTRRACGANIRSASAHSHAGTAGSHRDPRRPPPRRAAVRILSRLRPTAVRRPPCPVPDPARVPRPRRRLPPPVQLPSPDLAAGHRRRPRPGHPAGHHRLPGVRGIYSHVTAVVEQRFVDGLQAAGSRPLPARCGDNRCDPVVVTRGSGQLTIRSAHRVGARRLPICSHCNDPDRQKTVTKILGNGP